MNCSELSDSKAGRGQGRDGEQDVWPLISFNVSLISSDEKFWYLEVC